LGSAAPCFIAAETAPCLLLADFASPNEYSQGGVIIGDLQEDPFTKKIESAVAHMNPMGCSVTDQCGRQRGPHSLQCGILIGRLHDAPVGGADQLHQMGLDVLDTGIESSQGRQGHPSGMLSRRMPAQSVGDRKKLTPPGRKRISDKGLVVTTSILSSTV